MSLPFPLFHLPNVALSEVFNSTAPCDIIKLSMCSKKALCTVKHTFIKWRTRGILKLIFGGSKPSTVQYNFCPLLSIHETSEITGNSENLENVKIGGSVVPMDTSSEVTYWMDNLEGIRNVLDYVMEVFNSEVKLFSVLDDVTSSELGWIFNWIACRKTAVIGIDVNISQATREDLNNFFQNVNVTGQMELRGSPNSDYRLPRYPFFPLLKAFINITDGYWLKMRHLNCLNCCIISMYKTRFSSKDMNVYLRKWKKGNAFSRLKCLFIDITDVSIDKLLVGMDAKKVPFETRRMYKTDVGECIKLNGGFDVTRHDGVVATVDILRWLNKNEFMWLVWPDFSQG